MTVPIMHRDSGNFNDAALLTLATTRRAILDQDLNGLIPSTLAHPMIDELDARILGTRADSPVGIACKLRELLEWMEQDEDEPPFTCNLIRSILADVETLGRAN